MEWWGGSEAEVRKAGSAVTWGVPGGRARLLMVAPKWPSSFGSPKTLGQAWASVHLGSAPCEVIIIEAGSWLSGGSYTFVLVRNFP